MDCENWPFVGTARLRKVFALLLAGTFATYALAGCGGTPTQPGLDPGTAVQSVAPSSVDQARHFARQLQQQTRIRPTVVGDQVYVPMANGGTGVYDFSRVPREGRLHFRSGALESNFAWDGASNNDLSAKVFWPIAAAVAAKCLWSGAVALYQYWVVHQGALFDGYAAAKAVIGAVLSEITGSFDVVGKWFNILLWPICWKWLSDWMDSQKNAAQTALDTGMGLHHDVTTAISQAIALQAAEVASGSF